MKGAHMELTDFLPVSKEDMVSRGWYSYDFLVVTGDACDLNGHAVTVKIVKM